MLKTLESKKQEGYSYLKKVTAVDYVDRLEVLYFIYNPASHASETVKVRLSPDKAMVNTVVGIYKAADWHERELAEMFGIAIKGRKAGRLLLEKWNGVEAPLRKGFVWGNKEYKRI
ncbi:MAG: NADH-quinone oxidoreductase subunit C [Candidatus Micrarchaeota archaeon]|nr:NADH-quinone oxidoreductase subunit C [Candidatus Micrarchaeota archaeon]